MTTERSGRGDRRPSLERHYAAIEAELEVTETGNYEQLVVPNGNSREPIHRWFHLKEAFSRRLLPRVLKDTSLSTASSLRVLDPYAGGGTTAVALGELVAAGDLRSATFVGAECNPFLHLVAATKLNALQNPSHSFGALARRVAASAVRKTVDPCAVPDLATFARSDYFERDDLDALLRLRAAIDVAAWNGASDADVALARMCLGASIEPTSGLRRDGRALRFAPEKERGRPIREFLAKAEQIEDDLPAEPLAVRGSIVLGDGRTMKGLPRASPSCDLVLFSPPYPNNIDYTEVYKMEAWLLGFISDAEEFKARRLATVYSHPSIRRSVQLSVDADTQAAIDELVGPIITAVPRDRYANGRELMIRGYAYDMFKTLTAAFKRLKPGGHLIYVVGNSVHGRDGAGFVIAADLVIAKLARLVGYTITNLEIARELRRRTTASRFIRESVVFMQKPDGA